MMTVAFLGLGAMGLPMARNILRKGFPLRVWNRTRVKAEDLAEHGAVLVDSVADLAVSRDRKSVV